MLKNAVLPKLDVRSNIDAKNNEKDLNVSSSLRERSLEKYADFFGRQLSRLENYNDSNYLALEVVNDDGLVVSKFMGDNFKLCSLDALTTLAENPAKLARVRLVHAVLPFESVYPLVKLFARIPEITKADTRVILGVYDNYEDDLHDYNRRVLDNLIRDLDFSGYHAADVDGTSLKMVYSTYQKNLKLRRQPSFFGV